MTSRRTLDELKAAALQMATDLNKTPSRKELSKVVKESEYGFYGMTVGEFQEHCGLTANSSGLDKKTSDEQMLSDLAKVCLAKKEIPHQAKLRKWIRDGRVS
jgi:arsenate reductase-like glutaredoxin family protein